MSKSEKDKNPDKEKAPEKEANSDKEKQWGNFFKGLDKAFGENKDKGEEEEKEKKDN